MGSLDAYKDEIISQLLEGDWKNLFPRNVYSNLTTWLKKHKGKGDPHGPEPVVIRFTFFNPSKDGNTANDMRYAVYLLCDPIPKKGKVSVHDLKFSEEGLPLAIPPMLYERALYIMPSDLLDKILKKKKRSK